MRPRGEGRETGSGDLQIREGSSAPRRPTSGVWLAFVLCANGCTRNGEPGAAGLEGAGGVDEAPRRSGGSRVLEVGNPSRGVDQQPDYDGLASALRSRVADRLPDPLPSVAVACGKMLDAASAMYGRTEADPDAAQARLAATRDADAAACEQTSSAAAAVCVAIVLDEEGGEWPWVLDQCSRAFPRT